LGKRNFTALECGISAEAGEDDSPLVGFYKHCVGSKIFIKSCGLLLDEGLVCCEEGFCPVEAVMN